MDRDECGLYRNKEKEAVSKAQFIKKCRLMFIK